MFILIAASFLQFELIGSSLVIQKMDAIHIIRGSTLEHGKAMLHARWNEDGERRFYRELLIFHLDFDDNVAPTFRAAIRKNPSPRRRRSRE